MTNKLSSKGVLSFLIFSSRWLQAPLYIGLIIAQGIYVYQFIVELKHLVFHLNHIGENEIMLIVLGLIDVVMISNLLIMVIIGGYETFVSRLKMEDHPDSPEWLSHVNANTMKIKLALALIGISSIHLLKTFIDIEKISEKAATYQVIIHVAFLFSALAIVYTSKLAESITKEN
jgi:uncharacterized protein (TIGR00645 family)